VQVDLRRQSDHMRSGGRHARKNKNLGTRSLQDRDIPIDKRVRKLTLTVDRLVRQVMLMPYGIENAESACEGDSQNPRKVPHVPSSIEIGRIAFDLACGHRPAQGTERDRCVDEYDRQEDQRRQQHHEQRELA